MNRKIILSILVITIIVGLIFASTVVAEPNVENSKPILLKSRTIIPDEVLTQQSQDVIAMSALENDKVHLFVQFDHPLTKEEMKEIEKDGITLLEYIPENAWFASVSIEDVPHLATAESTSYIGPIKPDDKIAPSLRKRGVAEWNDNGDGTAKLIIIVFQDAKKIQIIELLKKYDISTRSRTRNLLEITAPIEYIEAIAEEDIVEWIEDVPPERVELLDGLRTAMRANQVQASPYNLTGTGIVVAEWDAGWVRWTHHDVVGRIIIGDNNTAGTNCSGCGISSHGTHVGGIVIGDGNASNGTYRGVAPNATLITYEWPYTLPELINETNLSITTYNASISTNSWSWAIESWQGNCYLHGNYDSWSREYDFLVNGWTSSSGNLFDVITIPFAAGNSGSGSYGCNPGFNTTTSPGATAKNTITVGATDSDDNVRADFSSIGPTDDGRLKPDVMAPGDELVGNEIWSISSASDTGYTNKGGTSMATPAVAGLAALQYQAYRATHSGADPLPSTIKAVLIHTATDNASNGSDANDTLGPDYFYGWGLVNSTKAIDIIQADANNTNETIIEANFTSAGQNRTYYINVPGGASELKVTMTWDDYPATAGAGKKLQNDLDLYLIAPNNTTYFAWTLNKTNPGAAAQRNRKNDLDNVEQVWVPSPATGNWKILVNASSSISGGTEYVSIVSTIPMSNTPQVFNCSCINCSDCEAKLNNTNCSTVWLTQDIVNQTGNCIVWPENSKTFDCLGNTIDGDDVGLLDNGINLTNKSGNIIQNCIVNDFAFGIIFVSSPNNNLINNNASSNTYGIYLYDSDKNNVTQNICNLNKNDGISIDYGSDNNILIGNTIINSTTGDGVTIEQQSSSNMLVSNTIKLNWIHGIIFDTNCSNNTVYNNNISSNIVTGIYIKDSNNNLVYNNNLINNTQQATDDGSNNFWNANYPTGGNYWSNWDTPAEGCNDSYAGTNQDILGFDKVCDSTSPAPYLIAGTAGANDSYPFNIQNGWPAGGVIINNVSASPSTVNADNLVTLAANVTTAGNVNVSNVIFSVNSGANQSYDTKSGDVYSLDYTTTAPLGIHNFTVWVNGTTGAWATGAGNFTVIDNETPVITNVIDTPDPVQNGNVITITATVTDNVNVSSVWMSVDGGNNTSMNKTGATTYSYAGADTSVNSLHNYNVYANDSTGNNATPKAGTYTVQPKQTPAGASPGGGGGGGGGGSNIRKFNITDEFKTKDAVTIIMLKNDIAYYAVDRETHTMTVSEVTENQVNFLVASEPRVEMISLHEENRWDLNSNNKEDIIVKYLNKSGIAAKIRFSKVEEELTRIPLAIEEEKTAELKEEPEEVVIETEKEEKQFKFSPASVLIATALLTSAIIIYTKPNHVKKLKKRLRPRKKPAKKKLFNPYEQGME